VLDDVARAARVVDALLETVGAERNVS